LIVLKYFQDWRSTPIIPIQNEQLFGGIEIIIL